MATVSDQPMWLVLFHGPFQNWLISRSQVLVRKLVPVEPRFPGRPLGCDRRGKDFSTPDHTPDTPDFSVPASRACP